MADRLSLANVLAEARIDRSIAERIATEIFDAIHDSVATKADLERLEATTRAEFAAVRAEMALLEHRLITRLGSLMVIIAGLLFAALHYVPPAH